ncbi:MAG: hypothetical protein KAG37_06590 [Flavobacteriales bacterium]|nr:hypothetical protein [Flavobacteriales bacterium]
MNYLKKITLIFIILFSVQGYSQNKLAILPFAFTDNGNVSVQEGKEAQQFLIGYINKKHKHFNVTVMNARDVNVGLHKAGITSETIDDFTTSEIADAVGADYVLIGSIDKILQGSSSVNITSESNHKKDWTGSTKSTVGSTSTNNTFQATVYISIFDKNNKVIYDKSKGNIFIDSSSESWKNSIIWQVRHFPLYH